MKKPSWFGGSQKEFNEMYETHLNPPITWARIIKSRETFINELCQPRYNPKMTKEQKEAVEKMENDKVNFAIHDNLRDSGIRI